ncbi:MAG TPA: hypothetical protein VKY73_22110 [Polyangiaceae bacterium]|nr:hypothetical protein [Polyangiaceae bacterium]
MKAKPGSILGALAFALAFAGGITNAHAEETVVVASTAEDTPTPTGPNPRLLTSGIWTLGLSYVPALVVAIESDHPGDKYLFTPVAGPWLNLAHRGDCADRGSCDNETLNKVLLVTDGVFQGIGALQILGAFLLTDDPQTTVATQKREKQPDSASVTFRPARFGTGAYGVAATGNF